MWLRDKIMGPKFPTKAMILTKRGKGQIVSYDVAGFFKRTKKGDRVYQLKKRKDITKPISYDQILQTADGQPFICLFEYERGQYAPVDLTKLNTENLDAELIIDEAVTNWGVVQDRLAETLHNKPKFWEQYGTLIMMFVMFLFIIILAWMFMKNISDTGLTIAQALNNIRITPPAG
jgi:hypothetical protein